MGTLKGVGRIYQQTFVDTHSKWAAAKLYTTLDELQTDLDDWIRYYNRDRIHQGKVCCGRTPMQTMIDGKKAYDEKVKALN